MIGRTRIGIGAGAILLVAALVACGGDDAGGGTSAPRGSGGRSDPAGERTPGAGLYASGCAPCHGARGEGTQLGPALSDRARDVRHVVQTVQSGVATAEPPHVPMPARGDGTWSDAQLRTVAEYVHSLAR